MATPVTVYKRGDTLLGYRVLEQVGTGAASHIYLVQDQGTKQIWAIKHVERHDHKDSRFLDQAVIEGEICEQLQHPNLRRIYKTIKKKTMLKLTDVYLLMEYVDGISMEREPPREHQELAVDMFAQTAAALAYMHERGFVHADMKPNNVMMVPVNEGKHLYTAKIIDLGQSCATGTIKPRIQGTPDYIAPEQVHRRPITAKTDIYNLGAMMYWVLTGTFIPTALAKGDSLVSRVDDNLLAKPKPVLQLNPSVHPRLASLIMQCVEPDGERRPESMAAVANELHLILGILRVRATGASGGSGASGAGMNVNQKSRVGDLSAGVSPGLSSGPGGGDKV